jgi:hypothetical protein
MPNSTFHDLRVWQEAMSLTEEILPSNRPVSETRTVWLVVADAAGGSFSAEQYRGRERASFRSRVCAFLFHARERLNKF